MSVPTPPIRLRPGDERAIEVDSRLRWNHTAIAVQTGEVYQIAAKPDSWWKDASHRVTPAGYEDPKLAPYRIMRRRRDAPWFELIGAVDESESRTFRVAERATVTMRHAGELVFYANDVRLMYWNNSGSIQVVVRRVS